MNMIKRIISEGEATARTVAKLRGVMTDAQDDNRPQDAAQVHETIKQIRAKP